MSEDRTPEKVQAPTDYEPLDPGRIDLLNPIEVRYWCAEFGCTEDELTEAVTRFGTHSAAVREHLTGVGAGKSRPSP